MIISNIKWLKIKERSENSKKWSSVSKVILFCPIKIQTAPQNKFITTEEKGNEPNIHIWVADTKKSKQIFQHF